MKIAIVTGASSGLGKAFAEKIANTGEVDELWLVARRADRLDMLKNEIDISVRPLILDLGDQKSIESLEKLLEQEKPEVGYLVNSAGFGKIGNYEDLTREECHGMLDINIRALIDVTRAVLPYMGRGSRLFQLASSSAFQPLPGFSVYAATKSFVQSFTRSLRWELRSRGIHVTAVCPGWVKTEFVNVAIDSNNGNVVKHFWPIVSTSFAVNSAQSQVQPIPGKESNMMPEPIYDNPDYKGAGRLNGKTAIITGGDSGIGRAITVAYAKEGCNVVIVYNIADDDANTTKKVAESYGGKVHLIKGDIGDSNFCNQVVDNTLQTFGSLDIVVNNAAEQHPQTTLEDITDEQLQRTFQTNIFAMFYLTRAALPHLKEDSVIIAYVFLATDASTYITGQTIHINGGTIING